MNELNQTFYHYENSNFHEKETATEVSGKITHGSFVTILSKIYVVQSLYF